jgi:hypothetical protein
MSFVNWIIVIIHAFIGWALCAAIMIIGRQIIDLQTTLIIHAIAAPIIFFLVSLVYFKFFNYISPFQTASIFTAFVIIIDVVLVAIFIEKSFAMFTSLIGTWIPFFLIFLSTFITGKLIVK